MLCDSNEYQQCMFFSNQNPQHMFLWRTIENYLLIIIRYPPYLFYCKYIQTLATGTTVSITPLEIW